jgi:hypothetical protein
MSYYNVIEETTRIVKENENNDVIFSNHSDEHQHITYNDQYRSPDYIKYMFTTFTEELNAITKTGLIQPVRYNPNFSGYVGANRLKNMFSRDELDGLVIVEYFTINPTSDDSSKHILDYYTTQDNVVYDDNIKNDLRVLLYKAKTNRSNCYNKIRFRVVTFIPLSVIRNETVVFHEDSDTLVKYGCVDTTILHPNSRFSKNKIIKDIDTNKTTIVLDIVTDNVRQEYYTKIGNKPIKLKTRYSPTENNGANLKVLHDGLVVLDKHSKLKESDLKENLGIYKSEEECIYDGDVKLKLEKEKLEHEKNKVKIEAELTKAKYGFETHKKQMDFEHDRILKKIDITSLMVKNNIDINNKLEKHALDLDKSSRDSKRSNIENGIKIGGTLINLSKLILK